MNKLHTLLLSGFVALLVGCTSGPRSVPPKINPVASERKLDDGTHEVQLRYSITTLGGPCLNDGFFRKRTNYETNWVYLKSVEGVVTSDQIIVSDRVDGQKFPYYTHMKGTITFDNGTMKVRLDIPDVDYKTGLETATYVPYYLNGTYTIASQKN